MGTTCVKGENADKNQPLSEILTKNINKIEVLIQKGDIVEIRVDAIVNPCDQKTSNQLVKLAGDKIQQEVKKLMDTPKGKAFVTKAGNLKAKNLININMPLWVGSDEAKETQQIKDALDNVFQTVIENSFSSIGFPEIFSGPFAVPEKLGTQLLISKIIEFCNDVNAAKINFKKIYLIHPDANRLKFYVEELEKSTVQITSLSKKAESEKLKVTASPPENLAEPILVQSQEKKDTIALLEEKKDECCLNVINEAEKQEAEKTAKTEKEEILQVAVVEEKPEEILESKNEEKIEESPLHNEEVESKVKENISLQVEEKIEEIFEEKVEEKFDEEIPEKIEEKTEKEFEENPEEKTEEKTQTFISEKKDEKLEEKIQEIIEEKLEEIQKLEDNAKEKSEETGEVKAEVSNEAIPKNMEEKEVKETNEKKIEENFEDENLLKKIDEKIVEKAQEQIEKKNEVFEEKHEEKPELIVIKEDEKMNEENLKEKNDEKFEEEKKNENIEEKPVEENDEVNEKPKNKEENTEETIRTE